MTQGTIHLLLSMRLRSVTAQRDAIQRDQATASDTRQMLNAGWLDAMSVEIAFLSDLIQRIEREGGRP